MPGILYDELIDFEKRLRPDEGMELKELQDSRSTYGSLLSITDKLNEFYDTNFFLQMMESPRTGRYVELGLSVAARHKRCLL